MNVLQKEVCSETLMIACKDIVEEEISRLERLEVAEAALAPR